MSREIFISVVVFELPLVCPVTQNLFALGDTTRGHNDLGNIAPGITRVLKVPHHVKVAAQEGVLYFGLVLFDLVLFLSKNVYLH